MMDTLTKADLGKVFAIQGPSTSTAPLLISLATRFQKYGRVLFIDADDSFNPVFVKKNYYKNTNLDLRKLSVARPFTKTQLQSLINGLHTTIPEHTAKAIVISGFDKLCQDPQTLEELAHITKKFNIFTLISLSTTPTENILSLIDFLCPL